jgi:simple sugar transport system permease protein
MSEILDVIFNINTFSAAIRISVPLVFAAIGGVFSERVGVINLGLEGMLLGGAFSAVLGSYLTGNPYIGVLLAMFMGAIIGFIFALFTLKFEANHVVAGVGLNILLLGTTTWLMQIIWGSRGTSVNVTGLSEITIPLISSIPIIGKLFGSHNILVYLMFVVVILSWIVLFRTPFGLRLRVIGEHPKAADTLGIKIRKIQYTSLIFSGVLCGLGGAYLSLGHLNWFSMNMSAGRGYMALAANIFGGWNPLGAFGASYLFAFTDALQMRMQALNLNVPNEIIQMVPYILTILVLAGAMIRSRPPAALGKHYKTSR